MSSIINYRSVTVERAEKTVLKNVSFEIGKGEFVYLVGKVGSGKSSLMKTMYGEVPVTEGNEATVMDYDILKLKKKNIPFLRRKMGIVFQDFQLLQDRSVKGNLEFVLRATGWKNRTEIENRIDEVLKEVGMENKSYKMPHELSGGEQQRIVIARALLNRPDLILADEPTGNLDPETGEQIVRLLHRIANEGRSVLMVTHNVALCDLYPGRVLECRDKELIDVR